MADLNKVLLMGRLTRDIELRYISNGTAIGEVGMAINRKFKKGEESVDETTFVDITIWGNQAETCAKYLHKGSNCFIEGRLNFDQWDDKESGKKRSKLSVVADKVIFLDPKESGEPYQSTATNQSTKETQKTFADEMEEDITDEIPF